MALVGIDLGTTNSLIAVWEDHKVKLLKNNLGHNMTPSVVGVDDDGSLLVGEIAKQRRVSHRITPLRNLNAKWVRILNIHWGIRNICRRNCLPYC